jgi:hypothetical protein
MSQRGGTSFLLPPTSRLRSVAPAYSYSIPFFLASFHTLFIASCSNMPNQPRNEDEPDFKGPTFEREHQDLIDAGLMAALAITSLQTIHRANQRKSVSPKKEKDKKLSSPEQKRKNKQTYSTNNKRRTKNKPFGKSTRRTKQSTPRSPTTQYPQSQLSCPLTQLYAN